MFVTATLVTLLVCLHGIPVLRHDWDWPLQRADSFWWWLDRTAGWRLNDFGQANPYPTLYLAATCKATLITILGPFVALIFYIFATTAALGFAAMRYAASGTTPGMQKGALVVVWLAVVNPWVYTQFVAGHLEMIWGLAGLFCAVAGVRERRSVLVGVGAVLALAQIQFFVLVCLCALDVAIRTRRVGIIAFCVMLFAPIAFAAMSGQAALSHIPFLLDWQNIQSIDIRKTLALSGYAAGYAQHTEPYTIAALIIMLGVRIRTVPPTARRALGISAGLLLLLVSIIAGPAGPFGTVYIWAMQHVRVLAVYRELYDLVGIIILVYVTGIARVPPREKLAALDAVAVVLLAGSWILIPPATFFLNAATLGSTYVPKTAARFALAPVFQPLRFEGQGNGIDPSAIAHSFLQAPLNSYFSTFPADVALARFAKQKESSSLARLGVASVLVRCRYATAADGVLQAPTPVIQGCHDEERRITNSAALVQIRAQPHVAVLDQAWSGNIFGGDGIADIVPLPVPGQSIRADQTWIDARLIFAQFPEISQAYGGLYTTSPAPVRMVHRPWILLWANGEVRTRSTRVADLDGHYGWRRFDPAEQDFTCKGSCLLAADADRPHWPLELPPTQARPARFMQCRHPAWCQAVITTGPQQIIEFNTRFDRGWHAVVDRRDLPHFPLDGFINAYAAPPQVGVHDIYFFHLPTLIEYCLELLACCTLVAQAVGRREIIIKALCCS